MSTPVTTLEHEVSALSFDATPTVAEVPNKTKTVISRTPSANSKPAPKRPAAKTKTAATATKFQVDEEPTVKPDTVIMVEDVPNEWAETATMADILEDDDDAYYYNPNEFNEWGDDDDYDAIKKPVSLLPDGIEAKDMRRLPDGPKQHWIVAIPTKTNKKHFGRVFAMPKGWNPSHGLIPETEKIKVTYPNGVTIERNQIKRKK